MDQIGTMLSESRGIQAATVVAAGLAIIMLLRRGRGGPRYPAPTPSASAVLVTGASTGIGRDASLALARAGLLVFASVRSSKDAASLLAENVGNGEIFPVIMDVTKPEQIAQARAEIEKKLQSSQRKFVGLVNNAGLSKACPIEAYPMDELRNIFEVNYFGVIQTTQTFLPLIRRDKGRIVNISSVMGFLSLPVHGVYCSSKFALEGLSDSLRREMDAFGVSVSIVEPGAIQTAIGEKAIVASQSFLENMASDLKPVYAPMLQGYMDTRAKAFQDSDTTEVTTTAIMHALLDPRPRTRYPVGAVAGKSVAFLQRMCAFLPDRKLDSILLKTQRAVANKKNKQQ